MKQYRDGNDLVTSSVAGNIIAEDATTLAINQAEEQFPMANLFIVTLRAGSVPDYNFSSPENLRKSALFQLVNGLKKQGRIIDHITIDTSIGQDLAAPNAIQNVSALTQAGRSICNSQNPRGSYQDIQKIVNRMNDSVGKTK